MNKEEKEAINRLYDVTHLTNGKHVDYIDIDNIATEEEHLDSCEGFCKATDIVLNLIKKQEAIIDKMAEQLAGLAIWNDNIQEPLILGDKEEVKEYFKKVVDEDVKD
jgi:hypothetical protein